MKNRSMQFKIGLEFFETSAKENINVKVVFERLVDIILEKMSDTQDDANASGLGSGNAYGNQASGQNRGTTKLTPNDTPPTGNQCQC